MTNMNAAFVLPPASSQKVNLQEAGVYLEDLDNEDRMQLLSSVAELFVKEFGTTKSKEIGHISQSIEASIFAKYSDPASSNYKGISKKVLGTLK